LCLFLGAGVWAWWVHDRSAASTTASAYGQFVLALVATVLLVLDWLGRVSRSAESRPLEEVADLLAAAVQREWIKAATERKLLTPAPIPIRWTPATLAVAGPPQAAVGTIPTLPGLGGMSAADLQAGGDQAALHAVYGGISSGRVVVVGAPGSGKTATAILLLLHALTYRGQIDGPERTRVPVPVLFTMHGWDPTAQRIEDWLAARMVDTYPLLQGRGGMAEAAALVGEGKIAVILDGLDEMHPTLRSLSLRALSEQAWFRVVLLSRSAEMAAATRGQFLTGAVALELHDVTGPDGADYLHRAFSGPPPEGWAQLQDHLRQRPHSSLTQALSTPLALTLIRDTYRTGDDLHELLTLQANTRRDVEDHLLSRVLPAAYTQRPGEPSPCYSLEQADRALTFIACRMTQDGTRDLAWWRIPRWAPVWPRAIASGLIGGLGGGLLAGIGAWLWTGLGNAIFTGFLTALGIGFGAGFETGLGTGRVGGPQRITKLRWRRVLSVESLQAALMTSLGIGLVVGLLTGPMGARVFTGVMPALTAALTAGLPAGFAIALLVGLGQSETDDTSPNDPLACWRADQTYHLVGGLVGGLGTGLAAGLTARLVAGLMAGVGIGFGTGLAAGLRTVLVLSKTWPMFLASAQLRLTHQTPLRLIRFLEDARRREVLRTVGLLYQFRHARLQDKLTAHTGGVTADSVGVTTPAIRSSTR
jgi:hypothetical protein